MIVPEKFQSAALLDFLEPKNNKYSPIADYCFGNSSIDLIFGTPCTKDSLWTVQKEGNGDINLVSSTGIKYLLGTFSGVLKVAFTFDKDSYPIVALQMPLTDSTMGVKVLKFRDLASVGSNYDTLLEISNARSPALCPSYNWDLGSINNQPCLFYIVKTTVSGSVKHIARLRSYSDKFASQQGPDINSTLLENDYIHRVGMCTNNTIQIEFARVAV